MTRLYGLPLPLSQFPASTDTTAYQSAQMVEKTIFSRCGSCTAQYQKMVQHCFIYFRADPSSCEVIERDTGSVQEFVGSIWRAEDSLFIPMADDPNPSTSFEMRTPDLTSEPSFRTPSPLSPSLDASDTISVLPTTPGHEDEQSANHLTHSDNAFNGIPLASSPSGLPSNAAPGQGFISPSPPSSSSPQLEIDNLADGSLSHAVESDLTGSATTQSHMFGGETPNSDGGSDPLTFALGPDAMNVDEPKGSLPQVIMFLFTRLSI
ncbi:hypothetical protein C8R47DRAFT_753813 [Mycena vitilis]|nr:hypothetical protein C8R47DRAFT_753813 [Mycena vitilis]